MLGKLLKYEIKATARTFLPLYIVLLVYSVIQKVIFLISPEKWTVPEGISMFVYVLIIMAVMVMTIVVMIQRFYKNLLTDEGYLMFTLPTKPWKHIVSKLIVSMMWTVLSCIMTALSIIIIAYTQFFTEVLPLIAAHMGKFFSDYGVSSALFTVEFIIGAIVSLASSVLIIYASIAVGQLFNRHRILASLGAFIVLNTVTQTLATIATLICGSIPFLRNIGKTADMLAVDPLLHVVIWSLIIFGAAVSAGYFILTNYILSRHLNLE